MRLILFLLLYFSPVLLQAQHSFSNNWIDYSEQYYKLSITKDGIYELSEKDLMELGISSDVLETKNPHLLHHGKETPLIWSKGNSLVFYAERNKGELDSLLYLKGSKKPHSDYALFEDAAAYFLVWNDEQTLNWTYQPFDSQLKVSDNSFNRTERYQYLDQYSFNNSIGLLPNLQQSYFEDGEGWTGRFINMDTVARFSYILEGLSENTDKEILVRFRLNGRSTLSHTLTYAINGIKNEDTLRFAPFGVLEKEFFIKPIQLSGNKVELLFSGIKSDANDWFSLSEVVFEYPNEGSIPNGSFEVYESGNFECGTCNVLEYYDRYSFKELNVANGLVSLRPDKQYRTIEVKLKPAKMEALNFDLLDQNLDYFIITNESLLEGAEAYKVYRESIKGGGYKVAVVTMDELYNQFTFGERNPIAIKNYLDWATEGNFKNKHLLLLGRGVSFPDVLKTWADRDLVPTIGYPGSDVLLSAGLDVNYDGTVQAISTGRLNVTENSEILNYLSKVKEIESQGIAADWKKRIAHLSGGKTESEISILKNTLKNLEEKATEGYLGAELDVFVKQSTDEVEQVDISQEVNEGVGLITFAGHGSANVIDLNIGYCSPIENNYNNKGKYPIMYFNGCGVGNVFYRYDPLTTDWLLTPDKGAIAVFANSFWSYQFSTQIFLQEFYKKLFTDSNTVDLTLGELHKEVNQGLSKLKFNPYVLSNIHQLILQGDPALRYFPIQKPDYELNSNSIFLSSANPSIPLGQNEELQVGVIIQNLGRFDTAIQSNLELKLTASGVTREVTLPFEGFATADTLYFEAEKLEYELIEARVFAKDEYSNENNFAELRIDDWGQVNPVTSFPKFVIPDRIGPLLFAKVNGKAIQNKQYVARQVNFEIVLKDENPLTLSLEKLQFEMQACPSCAFETIEVGSVKSEGPYQLIFDVSKELPEGEITIRVLGFDDEGNSSPLLQREIKVSTGQQPSKLTVFPNPAGGFTTAKLEIIAPVSPIAVKASVFDTKGVMLKDISVKASVGATSTELDLAGLAIGTYIINYQVDWGDEIEEVKAKLLKTN